MDVRVDMLVSNIWAIEEAKMVNLICRLHSDHGREMNFRILCHHFGTSVGNLEKIIQKIP